MANRVRAEIRRQARISTKGQERKIKLLQNQVMTIKDSILLLVSYPAEISLKGVKKALRAIKF